MGTFALCATRSRKTKILRVSGAGGHASRYITCLAPEPHSGLSCSQTRKDKRRVTTSRLFLMRRRDRKGPSPLCATFAHNSLQSAIFARSQVAFKNSSSSSANAVEVDSWKPTTRAKRTKKCLKKRRAIAAMLKPRELRGMSIRTKLRNVLWALATSFTTLNASNRTQM